MNLALFFEGTGQGVAGAYTNVTRLRDLCVGDDAQALHLEAGPGTHFGAYVVGAVHGIGWRQIAARAEAWLRSGLSAAPQARIFLFGFSRGALIARHFAECLGRRGRAVAYLGLWDTVDSTLGLDVPEECPANVAAARHAVARDEARRYFALVPLRRGSGGGTVRELVFPGSHSDVGGLYEDDHAVADATLAWIARGAAASGLRLKRGALRRGIRDALGKAVLHDARDEASNLWGAFGPVPRALKGIRRHVACRLLPPRSSPAEP